VAAGSAELMVHDIGKASDLKALLERADTVAIGPGLGTDAWASSLLAATLEAKRPLVIDADALNLLADLGQRSDDWILTPHPGEAGRLLGLSSSEIQADRTTALAALRERYGGTIVLKGAGTLVSASDGPSWLCTAGNPGMAAPGMGDVLTGVIAGLLVQRLAPELAAVCGVLAHAMAGDAAAVAGQRGMLASDLLAEVRVAVNP
jgi:NAD(P)H-hydrate epimerase